MKRIFEIAGAAFCAVAVVVMMLPTWQTTWLGLTPNDLVHENVAWWSPLLFGYANWLPCLSLLAAVVSLFGCLALALGVPAQRFTAGSSLTSMILAILGGIAFGGLVGLAVIAPVALGLAGAAFAAASRAGRRSRPSLPAPATGP